MSRLTPKKFALIASITAALVAPAFADDANISAVLRDVGTITLQQNARSAETARAQLPDLHRRQGAVKATPRVLQQPQVDSTWKFDVGRIGHN
jgi:hypothetical protein